MNQPKFNVFKLKYSEETSIIVLIANRLNHGQHFGDRQPRTFVSATTEPPNHKHYKERFLGER